MQFQVKQFSSRNSTQYLGQKPSKKLNQKSVFLTIFLLVSFHSKQILSFKVTFPCFKYFVIKNIMWIINLWYKVLSSKFFSSINVSTFQQSQIVLSEIEIPFRVMSLFVRQMFTLVYPINKLPLKNFQIWSPTNVSERVCQKIERFKKQFFFNKACHRFRLTKRVAYFFVDFDLF